MGSFPPARAQALIFLEVEPIMTANLTHPAIEIYWPSGKSSTYQILPCAASQKQLPLLKESGQQFSFLGHVLRLPDNKPVRECVMYRFQLRGGGNPEDSEPCSPVVYLLSSGVSWYPVKWQSAVGNGSRPPTMEEKLVVDCSSANGWWWWTSKQKLQGWQATRSLLALNGLKTLPHIALTRISLWKILLFKLQFYQPGWFGAFGVEDTHMEDDELKVYLKWTLHVLIYCTQLHIERSLLLFNDMHIRQKFQWTSAQLKSSCCTYSRSRVLKFDAWGLSVG